jgi:hypothetical protein
MHANLRPVSVIGTGMIKFGKHRDLTVPALAQPAVRDALREAQLEPKQIEAIYARTATSGWMPGQRVARDTGMSGVPVINCETCGVVPVPADQLPVGATAATFLVPGRTIGVRVLRPSPGSGRLLLTAVPVASTASLETMLEQRALARRRADRRPSLKELAAQPGIEREGVVVKVASYGVVVNVGARRPGLVHISKLQSGNGRKGAFIERVEAVCEVGDRVFVQLLPRSTAQRLSLRRQRQIVVICDLSVCDVLKPICH